MTPRLKLKLYYQFCLNIDYEILHFPQYHMKCYQLFVKHEFEIQIDLL